MNLIRYEFNYSFFLSLLLYVECNQIHYEYDYTLRSTLRRQLTLENMHWSVFENEEEREDSGCHFVQLVQEQLSKPSREVCHYVKHQYCYRDGFIKSPCGLCMQQIKHLYSKVMDNR